jgi:hypothetical protein
VDSNHWPSAPEAELRASDSAGLGRVGNPVVTAEHALMGWRALSVACLEAIATGDARAHELAEALAQRVLARQEVELAEQVLAGPAWAASAVRLAELLLGPARVLKTAGSSDEP